VLQAQQVELVQMVQQVEPDFKAVKVFKVQ
jgi:hypothetical protein